MVTTRSTARPPPTDDDSSSSDDASIPSRPSRPRRAATTTPATLRPPRLPAISRLSPTKRKREASVTSDAPRPKRRRQEADVKDTIEVQREDDSVDAAIAATNARPAPRLEVLLPTSRALRRNEEARSKPPAETATTDTTGRRLRVRRLGRGINSVEVFGKIDPSQLSQRKRGRARPAAIAETPEPEAGSSQEEDILGAPSPEPQGSPELQSSALKPKPARPRRDVYDFSDDEESGDHETAPAPPRRTINNLEALSRLRKDRAQARESRSPRPEPRRPSSREQQRPPPRPNVPAAVPRTGARTSPRSVSSDDEDAEVVVNGNELEPIDDSEEESSDDDYDEERDTAGVDRAFMGVTVRPYIQNERTIPVFGHHLNRMSELMGRSGWTGSGRRWRADMLRCTQFDIGDKPPTRTKLGGRLFASLVRLMDQLDEIDNAQDLAAQSWSVDKHHAALHQSMSAVNRLVRRVEALGVPSGSSQEGRMASKSRERLLEDLACCVIPMTVLVLKGAFAMGVKEPDTLSLDSVPQEAVFTWTTVQYLMVILGWLSCLQKALMMDLGPGGDASSNVGQRDDVENQAQNRHKLGVMVRKWGQQIRAEVDRFNEQADAERDRLEKARRDAAIRARRIEKEEEDLKRARERDEAFLLSLKELRNKPRPLAEKFERATAHWQLPVSSSQLLQPSTQRSLAHNSGPRASSGSSRLGVLLLTPAATAQRPASNSNRPRPAQTTTIRGPQAGPTASPELDLDYPPWPADETEWFMAELTRPDRRRGYLEVCAETLERPLAEVRAEKERLRRLGVYRSPVRAG